MHIKKFNIQFFYLYMYNYVHKCTIYIQNVVLYSSKVKLLLTFSYIILILSLNFTPPHQTILDIEQNREEAKQPANPSSFTKATKQQ